MRNAIADASPSRNKGFSLVEVAVAVALLSIATAVSLPRFNRLVIQDRSSAADTPTATHNVAPSADTPRPVPGVESPSAAVKPKLIDLIRGYPARDSSRVLTNWSGFAPAPEPNFPAVAKIKSPSGDKCAARDDATRSTKNAVAGANLDTHGC
jgi:prepilin-type N-terminal cleavage/methylation domain-containing protein